MTDVLDEPFFAVALAAFLDQAREEQGWPDPTKTRQRAYALFEAEKRRQDEDRHRADPPSNGTTALTQSATSGSGGSISLAPHRLR